MLLPAPQEITIDSGRDTYGQGSRDPRGGMTAVLPVADKPRYACSDEVNKHLLFVEYDGKDMYFNIIQLTSPEREGRR